MQERNTRPKLLADCLFVYHVRAVCHPGLTVTGQGDEVFSLPIRWILKLRKLHCWSVRGLYLLYDWDTDDEACPCSITRFCAPPCFDELRKFFIATVGRTIYTDVNVFSEVTLSLANRETLSANTGSLAFCTHVLRRTNEVVSNLSRSCTVDTSYKRHVVCVVDMTMR